jgi:hypothetical protein
MIRRALLAFGFLSSLVLAGVLLLADAPAQASIVGGSGLGTRPDIQCSAQPDSGIMFFCDPFSSPLGGQPNPAWWTSASSGTAVSVSGFSGNYGCDLATNNLLVVADGGQDSWLQQTVTSNGADAACLSDYTYLEDGGAALLNPLGPWQAGSTGLTLAPYYAAEVYGYVPIPPPAGSTATVVEASMRCAAGADSDCYFALIAVAQKGLSAYAIGRTTPDASAIEIDPMEVNASAGAGPQYAQYYGPPVTLVTSASYAITPSVQGSFVTLDFVWTTGGMKIYQTPTGGSQSLVANLTTHVPTVPLFIWFGLRFVEGLIGTFNVSNEITVARACQFVASGHTTCP